MRATFWGTRGSIAKAGSQTVRYGGNTSCVEVRSAAGTLVLLDCGTGAHGLGQALLSSGPLPVRGHILISHTHWDHIQGIPFFAPLFVAGNEWDVYAPRGLGTSLREALAGQMQYTYFPVTLEGLGATIRYHDLVEGVFTAGDFTVRTQYMNHPALTLGYRLEVDGVSVVYACDHEPYSRQYALGTGAMGNQDRHHVDFLEGADLVIHDAQYTAAEYADKIGWGHTPASCAVNMCRAAGVKQLALTHHDPLRDDDSLEELFEDARAGLSDFDGDLDVIAAREGMSIEPRATLSAKTPRADSEFSAVTQVTPAPQQHLVLIGVSDDQVAKMLSVAAQADELRTVKATGMENVLGILRSARPSLVVLDDGGAGGDALAATRAVRDTDVGAAQEVPVIVVADEENTDAGQAAGVTDWLIKPFTQEYGRTRIRAWVMRNTCRWVRAPLPANEEERVAALHRLGILDTEPEERFDRATRIAAAAFDVPIALVSLVDRDRQWFKSSLGLDARETPRDAAFCAHAILGDEVLVVPDALLDARFADNPLVTQDPHVRFYAGCPLVLPDGNRLGTLCVIDSRPREIDKTKLDILRELAKLVEEELSATSDS